MGEWFEKKVKELCIIGRGRVISQDEIMLVLITILK